MVMLAVWVRNTKLHSAHKNLPTASYLETWCDYSACLFKRAYGVSLPVQNSVSIRSSKLDGIHNVLCNLQLLSNADILFSCFAI